MIDYEQPLMPLDEFQRLFQAALVEAGYDTKEKILELIREVKLELAKEAGLLQEISTSEETSAK
ncbi:MAG: hypothetical protein R3E79_19155 [Caldilineaceae bacterium]